MSTHFTNSEDWRTDEIYREKAWHLLAVLLSIGRPARPAELVSRCGLFVTSPDFIEFLCSIPNSPLFMRDDWFVTISWPVISAIGSFVSKAVVDLGPRSRIRLCSGKMVWDEDVRTYSRKRKGLKEDLAVVPVAKRRLFSLPGDGSSAADVPITLLSESRIHITPIKAHVDIANVLIRSMNRLPGEMSAITSEKRISAGISLTPLLLEHEVHTPSNELLIKGQIKDVGETDDKSVHKEKQGIANKERENPHDSPGIEIDLNFPYSSILECESIASIPLNTVEISVMHYETQMDNTQHTNRISPDTTTCPESEKVSPASPVKSRVCIAQGEAAQDVIVRAKEEHGLEERSNVEGTQDSLKDPMDNIPQINLPGDELKAIHPIKSSDRMAFWEKDPINAKVERQPIPPPTEPATSKKRPAKSSAKLKNTPKNSSAQPDPSKVVTFKQQENAKPDQKCISVKEKLKQTSNMVNKESRPVDSTSVAPKKQADTKSLPNFDSFIIEEEEGSGGYGTVYRAKRKKDGKTFAIKYPHPNAHTHHINNELKMLERFGGRNFVIKFEGSFKSGNSECFVLEHVEHDRPEVLKREIDVRELQWYGYCMFRALASLHKQGVVHRDVKPGNFLFSRKFSKGYLIDFNLAMDLHQKYGSSGKSKTRNTSFDHVPLPHSTSTKGGKAPSSRFYDAANVEAVKNSRLSLEPKNMKKRASTTYLKPFPDLGSVSLFKSQGADGSGITSAKDATSTRTPSAERREQIFYKGRKELVNLAKAMEGSEHKARSVPASQSKRIAAPPGKVDSKHIHLSPMPLHSSGIAVSGAGLLKNKGDTKHKREGPCVGTKGFRAPEVLFKSPHQGFKVDVWSAGVTLLYLIIGKSPFVGDPEQNIKEIAKLKGSEDLWEVAKLHNRESSFPEELYDIQSLSSVELRQWCKSNTKRPDFIDNIPESLFDLLDQCLTVNPRLRITAEEALRHDFFLKCHEDLRKQRRLRQGPSPDSVSPSS